MTEIEILLALLFFAVAVLYSSVGHAGASGYIAAMALLGFAPEQMRPTALALNLLVGGIGLLRFWRGGQCFPRRRARRVTHYVTRPSQRQATRCPATVNNFPSVA